MATILTLAAGFLGLITAIISMVLFNTSPLMALAMWSATGFSAVFLALIWSMIPRRERAPISA